MMDELANQLAQVKERLTVEWDEAKARQALAIHHRRRVVRAAVTMGSAGLAVCAAAVVLAILIAQPGELPERQAVTPATPPVASNSQRPSPPGAPHFGVLADGSSWTAQSAGTRLEVVQDQPDHVKLVLHRGRALLTVSKRPNRSFEILADEIKVQVVGTVFAVQRDAKRVGVWVSRGRVSVDWPHGFAFLDAGEGGWFPPPEPELVEEPQQRPAKRHRSRHARDKRFVPGDPAGELLLAMDLARAGGEPTRAVKLLQRFLKRHPTDPRAPLAAFTLGRVLLAEIGAPSRAAAAFARARTLAPSGSLAEDALAREVEAWAAAGDLKRARERANAYLKRYPDGQRVQAVRRHARLR